MSKNREEVKKVYPHAKLHKRNKNYLFTYYLYYIEDGFGEKISNNAEKPEFAWHSAYQKIKDKQNEKTNSLRV